MSRNYFTRRQFDDLLEVELASVLSLSGHEDKHNSEDILEEDEQMQLALAVSQEDQLDVLQEAEEQDIQAAQILNTQLQLEQDEMNIQLAVALSESEQDRQNWRETLQTGHAIRSQQPGGNARRRHILVPQIRDVWVEVQDIGLLHSPGRGKEKLPEVYKNYRLVPTMFTDDHMWTLKSIRIQLADLQVERGAEEVVDWQEGRCESERCLVCLTNVATRVAVPCGHRLCCRPCVAPLIDKPLFYAVTSPNGDVFTTDRRVPIQCFVCRAIVGQIIVVH